MKTFIGLYSILFYFSGLLYVVDGDTVKISQFDKVRLRLEHIDAPESDQFYGDSSRIYLDQLIKSSETINYNDSTHLDRYKRPLIILYGDTLNLNLKMVEEGYAWAWKFTTETKYIEAMRTAQKEKKGLWKYPNPINPYDWRKSKKTRAYRAPESANE